jgi:hypothetical protein
MTHSFGIEFFRDSRLEAAFAFQSVIIGLWRRSEV